MDGLHLLLGGIVFGLVVALRMIGRTPVVVTSTDRDNRGCSCAPFLISLAIVALLLFVISQAA
jgi:hypothetical protein